VLLSLETATQAVAKYCLTKGKHCFYVALMIRSFKDRRLKRLFERGEQRGIRPDLLGDVEDILARLDQAITPQALNLPGYWVHPLKGAFGASGP
jgi:hypothetical protein